MDSSTPTSRATFLDRVERLAAGLGRAAAGPPA
jgi:hypothetical protein